MQRGKNRTNTSETIMAIKKYHEEISGRKLIVNYMTNENGRPVIRPEHVVDAFIVAAITFFSLMLGSIAPAIYMGGTVQVTAEQFSNRLITATLAFGLTFFAQWARYRGLVIIRLMNGRTEGNE